MVTSKNPPAGQDILTASANNLYDGVTPRRSRRLHRALRAERAAGEDATAGLVEEVYRVGGRYDAAIRRIVGHLEDAIALAPPAMRRGAAARWCASIAPARSTIAAPTTSPGSPIATRRSTPSTASSRSTWTRAAARARGRPSSRTSTRTRPGSARRSPTRRSGSRIGCRGIRSIASRTVTGVSARAIDVVVEAGDAAPMTPIGINLPNDQAIREAHGSKSVSLSNIFEAYNKSTPASLREEFSWSPDEAARAERWGDFAAELSTNLHEIIGHGSGLVEPEVSEDLSNRLREQYSTLEETRADLVALYFVADPQMVALGLVRRRRSPRHRPGRVRRLRPQRARAAAPRPRGHDARGRPHAQPPGDRALADGAHHRDRAPRPRRQDLLRDGRRGGVPRRRAGGCWPRCSASRRRPTTPRRRRCSRRTARTSRRRCATRSWPAPRRSTCRPTPASSSPSSSRCATPAGAITDVRITYPCDFTAQMLRYADRYATLPA